MASNYGNSYNSGSSRVHNGNNNSYNYGNPGHEHWSTREITRLQDNFAEHRRQENQRAASERQYHERERRQQMEMQHQMRNNDMRRQQQLVNFERATVNQMRMMSHRRG